MNKKKSIFLATGGESPAVLTEAIWALVVRNKMILTEIHVITTSEGKNKILEAGLIDMKKGPFARLWKDWKLPAKTFPLFGESQIHIPPKMKIKKDLGDSEANAAMEEEIAQRLDEFTKDPAVGLQASLAGGRKTMSAYLTLGMSAFAREGDTLYHVLMDPGKEKKLSNGWYPDPKKKAEIKWVNLFEVPFPRLNNFFRNIHLDLLKTSLTTAFEEFNMKQVSLTVNLEKAPGYIEVDGKRLDLDPKQSLWVALLAWRKNGILCPRDVKSCETCQLKPCRLTNQAQSNAGNAIKIMLTPKDLEFCRIAYRIFKNDDDLLTGPFDTDMILETNWWGASRSRLGKRLITQLGPSKAALIVNELGRGSGAHPLQAVLGIDRTLVSIKVLGLLS